MRKLAIIGASGHGRVVADIARKNGYSEIVFLDDDENIHECGGYPVIGKSAEAGMIDADVIVGIGNASVRRRIQESIPDEKLIILIHPDAVVAEDIVIGTGTVVMIVKWAIMYILRWGAICAGLSLWEMEHGSVQEQPSVIMFLSVPTA